MTISTLPSLVGRFRADSSRNAADASPSNGDSIRQLINLVSGGTDGVIQSTGADQPTYNSSSSNFNNRASISTDGASEFLEIPFGTLIAGNSYTLVHVFRFTTTATQEIGPRDSLLSNGTTIVGYTSSNSLYYRINNADLGVAYNIATESGTVGRSYMFHKNGIAAEVFRNGLSRGTTTVSSTKDIGGSIMIGKNGAFSGFYALEWCETLIFDTALSASERTTVNDELDTYYGL